MRAFAAFLTTAFLLASLATAGNAYPDLSGCSQRAGHHAAHSGHDGSDNLHASQTNHHDDAVAGDPDTGDACCGTCDSCNGYFDAHLQAVNLATACALSPTLHLDFSRTSIHASNFSSRPNLPPPKPASAHTPTGV